MKKDAVHLTSQLPAWGVDPKPQTGSDFAAHLRFFDSKSPVRLPREGSLEAGKSRVGGFCLS